jgi:cold shock protein
MAEGTVKWFNASKGYGFIMPQDGGRDVFVHITAMHDAKIAALHEGQTVFYELKSDGRGKMTAVNLKV